MDKELFNYMVSMKASLGGDLRDKLKLAQVLNPNIDFSAAELLANAFEDSLKGFFDALPKLADDSENINRSIRVNSQMGWFLSPGTDFHYYKHVAVNEELSNLEKEDRLEISYRTNKIIESDLNYILEHCHEKWKDIMTEVINTYKSNKYKICIITILPIIEFEISSFTKQHMVTNRKDNKTSEILRLEENRGLFINASIMNALADYIENHLFKFKEFERNRPELLNRHWVLHGKDDPRVWKEKDLYKLVSLLSSFLFVKSKQ